MADMEPNWPTEPGDAVEWSSDHFIYRFTNAGPDQWIVHRRGHLGYRGRLERAGNRFDYTFEDEVPPQSGGGTGSTWANIQSVFL